MGPKKGLSWEQFSYGPALLIDLRPPHFFHFPSSNHKQTFLKTLGYSYIYKS